MTSEWEFFNELFTEEARLPLNDEYDSTKSVMLSEPQQSKWHAMLYGLPKTSLVVRLDDNYTLRKIFKSTKGECRRGDFIVVAISGKKKTIICVEMTSSPNKEKQMRLEQLKGSQCFIRLCDEVGRVFWGQDFLEDFQYRFVSISGIKRNRRKTQYPPVKVDEREIPNSPEKHWNIKNGNDSIRFERIAM
ncbi:MAG: hypothetical protein NUW37_17225 [Planctomycetes bacterium]|nr:hypothetical protein [Planctomycetota bacterium]